VAEEAIMSQVESIESEAEKLLMEARNQANEILRKANEEASKILSAKITLTDVKAECQKIIDETKQDTEKQIEASKNKAVGVKTAVSKRVDEITQRIIDRVTGVKQ
jgi:vacuolar-type H+-ATPase subunit H